MKRINLTKNKYVIVDNEDYGWLTQHKWFSFPNGNGKFYAKRNDTENHTTILMHREILGLSRGDKIQVDHINGREWDNRRINLRLADSSLNNHNRRKMKSNTTSQFWGVSRCKQTGKFVVFLGEKNLGRYNTELEGALVYDRAAIEKYGDKARTNVLSPTKF